MLYKRSNDRPVVRQSTVDSGVRKGGSQPFVTVQERTNALVRGLRLVLQHHACPSPVLDDLCRQIREYLNTSKDEKVWLKRAKDVLTYPLSKYLRNELPQSPDIRLEFSGAARRWVKNRLFAFNKRNTHLWYSWFQCKRSSLPASDSFVESTYDDHFASLTKSDPGDEMAISAIFSDPTFQELLQKLRKEIKRRLLVAVPFEEKQASSSACFERTRKGLGQQGELLINVGLREVEEDEGIVSEGEFQTCPILKENRRICFSNIQHTTDLWSMVEIPKLYTKKGAYHHIAEIRAPCGGDQWSDLKYLADLVDKNVPLSCTIQAVLEPFKVRVISKGNALPYYSCRNLQQAMHGSMRELPCFRLIGRPFMVSDMQDLRQKAKSTDEWFSVDYSAATDGISWKFTSRILRYLLDGLARDTLERALQVLGPHDLYYPTKKGAVFRGLQENGQLMGSILSFPILCLANLGAYLVTTRIEQESWSYKERLNHVLVNGDDMIYAAPPHLWARHIQVAKDIGLNMSVGKAYHHKVYANINSTSIHCPLERPDLLPVEIPYLNVGLFFGQHKIQGKKHDGLELAESHHGDSSSFCTNWNTLLRGSRPGQEQNLMKMYLSRNQKEIAKESRCLTSVIKEGRVRSSPYHRNLFLPISRGGMGCEAPPGFRFKIRPFDRVIAKNLENGRLPETTARPLPGFEAKKLDTEKSVPWVKHKKNQDTVRIWIRRAAKLAKCLMTLPAIIYSLSPLAIFC